MKIKKIISTLLGLTMYITNPMAPSYAFDNEVNSTGGLFFIKSSEDFNTKGFYNSNIDLDESIGDGALVLKKGSTSGIFTSKEINTEPFEYLVVSLNADTPRGTWVEVEGRAYITHYDKKGNKISDWSDWLSWGSWGTYIERASTSDSSTLAKISTDEFMVKGSLGETASKFQLRVTLHSNNPDVNPSLRQLTATYKNTLSNQSIAKYPINVVNWDKVIDAPAYSQYIRQSDIAGRICSPTSLTMLLNLKGENLIVEETAWGVYDNDYMAFGNWAFNAAFAGSRGYEAYIEYGNLDVIKREISNGNPVAVSVKYTNDPNNTTYPYIENSPMTTGGHIIVVSGFKNVNGVQYVVVNDPAAKSNDEVNRMYKLDDFEKAWARGSNIMYIVHDKEANAGYGVEPRVQGIIASDSKGVGYNVIINNQPLSLNNKSIKTILATSDNGFTSEYIPYKKSLFLIDSQLSSNLFIIGSDGLTYTCTPSEK